MRKSVKIVAYLRDKVNEYRNRVTNKFKNINYIVVQMFLFNC